jgi:hypothetical protein
MPVLPDRAVLRAEFDAAIQNLIDKGLTTPLLTSHWYARIGNSVFDACYRALEDACEAKGSEGFSGTPYGPSKSRLHVISSPVGGGKASFSVAFIAASVRLAERDNDAPYGCIFVTDLIKRADDIYGDLNALIPGKVAVWTSQHDPDCKDRDKDLKHAGKFRKDDLKDFSVAVVTHKCFTEKGNAKVRQVLHNGRMQRRALTVIDEKIDGVKIYDIELSALTLVREQVQRDEQAAETIGPKLDALLAFMADRSLVEGSSLEKPTTDPKAWSKAERDLQWFTTGAASAHARKQGEQATVVFGFAKALATGSAFINRQQGTHFVGYERNLVTSPGTVLLDATADIDGVSQLCPWREHQETPRARYDNLQIVHVPIPKTRKPKSLTSYLKGGYKNKKDYVEWMMSIIKQHVEPGQKALVVCKKLLFDDHCVPNWPKDDERHNNQKLFREEWGWDVDGRKLCAIHWGIGIGDNAWNEADVVLLLDQFYQPRRIPIATVQGLRGDKSTEGDLGTMGALNTKAPAVDTIQEGHLLRWTKQMALRGRGRSYDAQGVCGHQKLVCCGDFKTLLAHSNKLFPGAQIKLISPEDGNQTQAEALLEILNRPGLPPKLTQRWISLQMKRQWRDISRNILKEPIEKMIRNLGWKHVSRKGRGGSYFERIDDPTGVPIAA